MKKTMKFLGLAFIGMLFISTGCDEETIEEDLGILFTVTTSDGGSWSASTTTAKMEGSSFVITASKDNKKVVLTVKEFAKSSYFFDDPLNHATYTPDHTDATKLYSSTNSDDNYIQIVNIHSDGSRSDGKFSFLATDANNDVLTISGTWLNVSKN